MVAGTGTNRIICLPFILPFIVTPSLLYITTITLACYTVRQSSAIVVSQLLSNYGLLLMIVNNRLSPFSVQLSLQQLSRYDYQRDLPKCAMGNFP
jgi:hypothetical protein